MITSSRATLSVHGTGTTAAAIADALGMAGHEENERGDATKAASAGRRVGPGRDVPPRSHWSWTAPDELIDPDDQTGFGAVQALVSVFAGKAAALESLRPDCETIIWWSGDSDSSQGGFVVPAGLLRALAELGCDLYGTAFISQDRDA